MIHVQERERDVYKLCQECCQDMNTLMVFRFGEDFESWEAYDTWEVDSVQGFIWGGGGAKGAFAPLLELANTAWGASDAPQTF